MRRFRPGLDYTVGHHGLLEADTMLDATLCFVGSTNACTSSENSADQAEADEAWDSGSAGGYECYIAAEVPAPAPHL